MKSQYRTIAVLLAASLSFAVSANAQTVWTNAGTANWFTAGNWSAGVPNSGVDAQVNNGGTARINSGTGAANSVTLGLAAGNSGGLLVQTGPGSTLNVTNDILIGDAGTG